GGRAACPLRGSMPPATIVEGDSHIAARLEGILMSGSAIIENARKNFRSALAADAAASLPPDGWRWHAYRLRARPDINRFKTPEEAIRSIQGPDSSAGYEARITGQALVEYARIAEQGLRNLFPQFAHAFSTFAESALSLPQTVTLIDGRLVSSQ